MLEALLGCQEHAGSVGRAQHSSPSPQQVLHTHFLSFLGTDLARHVLEGLGGRGAILQGHTNRILARDEGLH